MTEEITQLLLDHQDGKTEAIEKLYPVIYNELHRIAHRQLNNAWDINTICTTALVNEAYIKLIGFDKSKVSSREHFFAIAAKAMRQIILNYAEKKRSKKRGGDWKRVTGIDNLNQSEQDFETLLSVDRALKELEQIDQNLAQLVELRFYAGMTEEELAQVFEVTTRTVRRNWKKAKAFLAQTMQ